MSGGIQFGMSASSEESMSSEGRHKQLIAEVVASLGSEWSLERSISIEETMGSLGEYSILQSGKSQKQFADGGILCFKGRKVGVFENKYQANRNNACQRAALWGLIFPWRRCFFSFSGPGFKLKKMGGSTGPLIDLLRFRGSTVLENEKDDQVFKAIVKKFILNIKDEETGI